ncbi:hypothetical protein [Nocardioides lijunqiniae]|uniref:hypothetical protein n=1 Tax=Nocardioides lijunqiniae TaxID=2760832 RepID=UPI0018787113|nr:hypothetical protein [Nocardioides lijunqiniae]
MRPTLRARRARLDPAVRGAREVVGMYGDPDTTWGICLEAHVGAPVDGEDVGDRVAALCAEHPHLGVAPEVAVVAPADWSAARREVASAPYGPSSPLLRLALTDDGTRLLVGAHHGVIDGLGLLAVAGSALGRGLRTRARGIGDRAAPYGFLASSVRRLGEALTDPPARFGGDGEEGSPLEDLSSVTRPRVERGTAHLAHAVLAAHTQSLSRGSSRGTSRRPVLVIGASRRTDDLPQPDRQTAYLRLRVGDATDAARLAPAIAALRPEPDFPETSAGGTAPLAVRLLSSRLGATAMLSNLGLVLGQDLVSLSMFPASSGPRSVAVGLASTTATTTLSLRTRRRDFTAEEHAALVGALTDHFFERPAGAQ